ncbi:MAG: TAXI family TRAP transporter solute-binding subunit [Pseudomonadales bacterium]
MTNFLKKYRVTNNSKPARFSICRNWSLVTALVVLSACSQNEGTQSTTYTIATGGTAGLYYPIGGAMASVWSRHLSDVNAKAEVTGGSIINVIQVSRHESELGFSMADVVNDAYLGEGKFPAPLPVRVLLPVYPNVVHILSIEGSGISLFSDLRGKRVSLGSAGSGTANTAEKMLSALGLKLDDIGANYLSFGETVSALKDGAIDAGFIVGGLGIAAVTELAASRELKLIELTPSELGQLINNNPAYSSATIPAGTYGAKQAELQALAIWNVLVVHKDLPEQLAYDLACTLIAQHHELLKISPVAKSLSLDNLNSEPTARLHAASLRLRSEATPCAGLL